MTEIDLARSLGYVDGCIAFLEEHAERVRKALVALKTLRTTAEQFDSENVRVMAQAIIDRGLGPPNLVQQHGAHMSSNVVGAGGEVLPPFDPTAPTRAPNDQEVTHYQRIVAAFVEFGNRPISTSTLMTAARLTRGAVATVLYTTHRDKFEKLIINGHNRWHLQPEVYEHYLKSRKKGAKKESAD